MTEQERRVVNHAMKILEQSQDEEARALAVKLLEQGTKVPLQKVQFYAAYCNGLRDGYSRIFDLIQGGGWLAKVTKKEMPYFLAIPSAIACSLLPTDSAFLRIEVACALILAYAPLLPTSPITFLCKSNQNKSQLIYCCDMLFH